MRSSIIIPEWISGVARLIELGEISSHPVCLPAQADGKSNASFNPGGQFIEPAKSDVPLVNFKVAPRMSLYLEDEDVGSLLVNASISEFVGVPYHAASINSEATNGSQTLSVQVFLDGSKPLLNASVPVKMGTVMEVPISFSALPARLEPYNITAVASDSQNATFDASTQISRLPLRQDHGIATRIDNRYGSTAVRKAAEKEWKPIFPYTYYGRSYCQRH